MKLPITHHVHHSALPILTLARLIGFILFIIISRLMLPKLTPISAQRHPQRSNCKCLELPWTRIFFQTILSDMGLTFIFVRHRIPFFCPGRGTDTATPAIFIATQRDPRLRIHHSEATFNLPSPPYGHLVSRNPNQ